MAEEQPQSLTGRRVAVYVGGSIAAYKAGEGVTLLRRRGAVIVGPAVGRLASGRSGAGRMVEPRVIVEAVESVLSGRRVDAPGAMGATALEADRWLAGERVVVTSGGTREPIDPVRYIGN